MNRFTLPAWSIAACLVAAGPALADGDRFPLDPIYREECGSCHVAYPPKLLPQAGWRSTLGSLDRHFGSDASVEPALARRLDAYLQAHAGRDRGDRLGASPRITETAHFRKEHRKVDPAIFASAPVNSAANCTACHAGAADGNYDEDAVRVPRASRTSR